MSEEVEEKRFDIRRNKRGIGRIIAPLAASIPVAAYAWLNGFGGLLGDSNGVRGAVAGVFLLLGYGGFMVKLRAGDTVVIRGGQLLLFRGKKQIASIVRSQIQQLDIKEKMVILKYSDKLVTFEAKEYQPEVWSALKTALPEFYRKRVPILGGSSVPMKRPKRELPFGDDKTPKD